MLLFPFLSFPHLPLCLMPFDNPCTSLLSVLLFLFPWGISGTWMWGGPSLARQFGSGPLGGGAECWRGFYESVRPTRVGTHSQPRYAPLLDFPHYSCGWSYPPGGILAQSGLTLNLGMPFPLCSPLAADTLAPVRSLALNLQSLTLSLGMLSCCPHPHSPCGCCSAS